jgi:dipeptidyl aminopeptidase/acylaminoacyl peptidase
LEDGKFKKTQNIEFKFEKIKPPFPLVEPKLFNFKNKHGDTIYGLYYKPHDYNSNKKYPALLYIYGGPGPQLVVNKYSIFADGRLQHLASLGYIIITIDGRGSNNRGIKFESILKHRMGQVEFEDQIYGIKHLASNKELDVNIDLNRIGVFGWSYGGYMSLMALGQHSDFFKVAISGAPVTKWELYDT